MSGNAFANVQRSGAAALAVVACTGLLENFLDKRTAIRAMEITSRVMIVSSDAMTTKNMILAPYKLLGSMPFM